MQPSERGEVLTVYRMLGITSVVAFVVSQLARHRTWSAAFDEWILLSLLGGVLAFQLLNCEARHWSALVSFLFRRCRQQKTLAAVLLWLATARRGCIVTATSIYVLGLIAVLSNLANPVMLGFGVATSLLSVLYGLLASEFVLRPMLVAVSNIDVQDSKKTGMDSSNATLESQTVRQGDRHLVVSLVVVVAASAPVLLVRILL